MGSSTSAYDKCWARRDPSPNPNSNHGEETSADVFVLRKTSCYFTCPGVVLVVGPRTDQMSIELSVSVD